MRALGFGTRCAATPEDHISPDRYGMHDQAPVWNYIAVEPEETMRLLKRDKLIAQSDLLSPEQEQRIDKAAWTRAKLEPAKFDKMLDAIVGFQIEIQAWRGTLKLAQNKPDAARLAAAERTGQRNITHWMRSL